MGPHPIGVESALPTSFQALTRRDLAVSAGRAAAAFALVLAQPWRLTGLLDEAIAATPAVGFADADYWAFIDPIVEHMDRLWDERDSCYAVSDAGETVINAALCTIHAQARAAGMAPLDRTHHALLEAWVERVLLGYWRHAGFLNWDSGLGLTRWQIGKTFAFAQQGLLAIAKSPQFHSRNEFGPWAKYLLDQGFVLYQRWAKEDGDGLFAPPFLNDAHAERGGGQAGKWLFAVRMAVNAARAIDLGLGTAKAAVPKPFYAFDPDIGRLAVSTPTYSAALLGDNRGAVPYGGIEIARLYDADGRPVATIGGTPPGGFGIVVRDSGNRQVLTSQKTLRGGSVAKPSIRLTDAPRGRGRLASFPRHAYADAFNQLAAVGVLNDVAWFYVQSLKSGYVVVVRKAPARALAFALPTHPSGFEPHPGPTLAIRLSNASRVRRRVLTAAIAPARTAAEAEAVAASLLPDK